MRRLKHKDSTRRYQERSLHRPKDFRDELLEALRDLNIYPTLNKIITGAIYEILGILEEDKEVA